MNQDTLYPPEDHEQVMEQIAAAANVLAELRGFPNTRAIVTKSWHKEDPAKYGYGFRFDPTKTKTLGEIINDGYGRTSRVIAIIHPIRPPGSRR